METYGRLDYACNNVGISGEENQTADYSIENWQRTINMNLTSIFYCLKYQIPAMLKQGGGAIVNMASILGQVGFAGPVFNLMHCALKIEIDVELVEDQQIGCKDRQTSRYIEKYTLPLCLDTW